LGPDLSKPSPNRTPYDNMSRVAIHLAEAHELIGRSARRLVENAADVLDDVPEMDTGLKMFLMFGAIAGLLIVCNICRMCAAACTPDTDEPPKPIPPPALPKSKSIPRNNSRQKKLLEYSRDELSDLEEGERGVKAVKSLRKPGKLTKDYLGVPTRSRPPSRPSSMVAPLVASPPSP